MTRNEQIRKSKKELKLARKRDNLCIQCGLREPFYKPGGKQFVRCDVCLDYQHNIRLNRRELDISYAKKYRENRKNLVFVAYGNKCACCNEMNQEFLTVDHINNDGGKHRRIIGSGSYALYGYLIDNHYPSGFQLLCGNCHLSKNRSGVCIHQIANI